MRIWLLIAAVCTSPVAISQVIVRSSTEIQIFKRQNPCPASGKLFGTCPGYQVDHSIPLCAGGLDKMENMAWLTVADHRWKTRIDVRECRKLRIMANTPAR